MAELKSANEQKRGNRGDGKASAKSPIPSGENGHKIAAAADFAGSQHARGVVRRHDLIVSGLVGGVFRNPSLERLPVGGRMRVLQP
jgi:hypothetical protein